MTQNRKVDLTPSKHNVFRDVGLPSKEARHLLIRADLMNRLQEVIASRDLTQAEAAGILRVSQPRVSNFCRDELIYADRHAWLP